MLTEFWHTYTNEHHKNLNIHSIVIHYTTLHDRYFLYAVLIFLPFKFHQGSKSNDWFLYEMQHWAEMG